MSNLIQKAFIVPGQPHIPLAADLNAGWASLKQNYEAIGREIESSGAELMLVYSTQWFSVIGHLFQVDPNPKWLLVDQNWYEFGEIPYEFRIDAEFGELYCARARANGLQASTVNYHGFPIDTGSVVALKMLNPNNTVPASLVSCNIYAERDETRTLGRAAREAIEAHGKKTIVVCVTNFSNRYEVTEIKPGEDRVSSAKDDEWNQKILEILGEGRLEDVAQLARDFAREANADMGFKAIWWLAALMGEHNRYDGKVWDYQPVWGTGAALVELTPSDKKTGFEKEFDEAPVGGAPAAEAGSGLETHNVTEHGTSTPSREMTSSLSTSSPVKSTDSSQAHVQKSTAPTQHSALSTQHSAPTQNSIYSANAPKPVGPYPHAKRVGDLLYLSGIGPRQPGTDEIPGLVRDASGNIVSHDVEVQTRAVIENIKTILEDAGSSLEKIVDCTVFLTDMKRDFATFNKVYTEYFEHIQPTRTTVGVDSLPTPIAVELKVVALAG